MSTDTKQAYHGLEKRTDDYGHIKFIIVCYCFISFYWFVNLLLFLGDIHHGYACRGNT